MRFDSWKLMECTVATMLATIDTVSLCFVLSVWPIFLLRFTVYCLHCEFIYPNT